MDTVFGSVALITLGHVAKSWNAAETDGLVTACDTTYLEGNKDIKIGVIYHRNTEDELTGDVTFIFNEVRSTFKLLHIRGEVEKIPDLNQAEKSALAEVIKLAAETSKISLESGVGEDSCGEGGEVRVSDNYHEFTPGAFVLSVSFYDLFDVSFDSPNGYGLNTKEEEALEYEDYGCVIFVPDSKTIEAELKDALDYLEEGLGTSLLIQLLKKYRSTEGSELSFAWQKILDSLATESYAPSLVYAARIAKDIIGDETLWRKLLDQAVALSESGVIKDHYFGIVQVASEFASSGVGTKEEIYALLDTIPSRLSLEDPNEICHVIENIACENRGCRMIGESVFDVEYARNMSEAHLARIEDKKMKAKFKKQIEKAFSGSR